MARLPPNKAFHYSSTIPPFHSTTESRRPVEAESNCFALTLCTHVSQTSVHFQVTECHVAGEGSKLKLHIPYAVSQGIYRVSVRLTHLHDGKIGDRVNQ